MSTLPPWAGQYIGIPFVDKGRSAAGADCWGLVRLVLAEQFAIELPDYADAYRAAHDSASVSEAVQAGLRDGWSAVTDMPRCGDLLVIQVARRPWHCGLMLCADRFLHCPTQQSRDGREIGSSCIERLDALIWRRRIEGVYRHVSLQHCEAA